MDRNNIQQRCLGSQFKTRDDGDNGLYIEGYFAVFNSRYDMWEHGHETIAPGAFSQTLDRDIRALIDHESRLVLGRTTAFTLELKEDDKGLWGRIQINPNDTDAMNLYERVKRGDVNQCSFGFEILEEETDFVGEDIFWTLKKVRLHEVSVCTFPAYEETSVDARKKDYEAAMQRKNEAWKADMLKKLKGEQNA